MFLYCLHEIFFKNAADKINFFAKIAFLSVEMHFLKVIKVHRLLLIFVCVHNNSPISESAYCFSLETFELPFT